MILCALVKNPHVPSKTAATSENMYYGHRPSLIRETMAHLLSLDENIYSSLRVFLAANNAFTNTWSDVIGYYLTYFMHF